MTDNNQKKENMMYKFHFPVYYVKELPQKLNFLLLAY